MAAAIPFYLFVNHQGIVFSYALRHTQAAVWP